MTSVHSTDLQWLLVRRNNKFYQNRGHVRLSNDPFSNTSRYTKRHAGFLQTKVAVVKVSGGKNQIYLTTKDGSAALANKPNKMFKTQVFPAGVKASVVANAAKAVRPDLADTAFRRARKLGKAMHHKNSVRSARKTYIQKARAKKPFKRTHKRVKTLKKK